MQETDHSVENLDELRDYVHETLCQAENLLAEQFQTEQFPLYMKDRLCGMQFSLRGLRSVRLGAVWAADQNVLYFYNARGERYRKVRLNKRISLQQLAE
jgi:hypothetical protein